MKIESIDLTDYKPIKRLSISHLGSTIVIAGANGSGKTRLKDAIVQTIKGTPLMDMTILATRAEERDGRYFNGERVVVKKGVQNPVLKNYINSRKYGSGRYVGSVVQIDSSRSVQSVTYNPVNWLGADPDDADAPSNFYLNPFTNRWQDFVNYIHQKSAARDKKLAEAIKGNPDLLGGEILSRNPNPLDKYKEIFSAILPGKTLLDINPAKPGIFRYLDESEQELPFSSLSSGEQEVIKVLFDVARKDIRHSVLIVDEPELHLHPTLTFKLIEALKNIGDHTNQFIFLTHSPDLISTYYSTGDVYFIDQKPTSGNQAHRLSDLEHEHKDVASLVGQNLGLFAVGKKLVFVEGENSSIDRQSYQKIAQPIDPEIRVLPAGSVLNILALANIEEQIRKSIFGIDIYMIRDRDGLSEGQVAALEKNGRIRCLKRRHIENYFLDEEVLMKVAQKLYLTETAPALSEDFIAKQIRRIAEESLPFNVYKNVKDYLMLNHFFKAPTVKSLETKGIEQIKTEIVASSRENRELLFTAISDEAIEEWVTAEEIRLQGKLADGGWICDFQGKYIFSRLCSDVLKADQLRIRHAYVDTAIQEKPGVFSDISEIIKSM
jgi:ABC-type cobalamin/Fe3+-siderophores transport system ATPase subunit